MLQNIRYLPMEQSFLSNEIDTLEFPSRDSVQYGRRYQQKLLAFFWRSVFGETIRGLIRPPCDDKINDLFFHL